MVNPVIAIPVLVLIASLAGAIILRRRYSVTSQLGRVIYQDADANARTLTDWHDRIKGKPDFMVAAGIWPFREYRPVEYKSLAMSGPNPAPRHEPRIGDVMQVAVYGHLVEAEFGKYPRYGYVVYRGSEPMRIKLGPAARNLTAKVAALHRNGQAYPIALPVDGRCNGCPLLAACRLHAKA